MSESSTIPKSEGGSKQTSRFFGIKIIKTRFQFKFSLIIFVFLAISAACIWFWGNTTVNRIIDAGMVQGDDAIESMRILRNNIAYISFLALAITFGLSLFFSHYIAGPIYRFEKTLESMRDEGNLGVFVRIRKHDEFKETADLFNQTLVSLRNRVKREREGLAEQVDRLTQMVSVMKKNGQTKEANELEQIVLDIKNVPPQIKI